MAAKKKDLPAKETALFKQILRQYEFKQYKKGLKAAEQILKKFPEHGETLAMKGLFLNHLNQKTQAYDYVKLGLRHDLFSPICWHVYGLLYRSDKNYEEAMKCYRHALKYDKENLQVLRDFSFLQIQVRDYQGFHDTQQQLLKLRPSHRVYWIGLALSYHFLGKQEMALKVLEAYEETSKDRPEGALDYEHSEYLLFKNQIISATGNMDNVLENLDKIEKQVCDKTALKERRLDALLKLKRNDEAIELAHILLDQNPDSFAYIDNLKAASGISPDSDYSSLIKFYDDLAEKYPRSHALKRAPLNFADGPDFQSRMDAYLRHMFRKGVPSLFSNIKSLYGSSRNEKVDIIESLVLGYHQQLLKFGRFLKADKENSESPSTILWVLYFLSQHYDRLRNFTLALEYIEQAITHTPTVLELIMFKGRIFKHVGNPLMAAHIMDDARKLDLQDRFINTKSTKYWIRCDDIAKAESTVGLFTRQGTHEEKMQDLIDMQCIWYALEVAESHIRNGNYGRALKRYHQLSKHFDDFLDDQFDFHTYCLRKMTLCSYMDLLRMEDRLHDQDCYKRAARGAVKCYIHLYDHPEDKTPKNELDGLSAKEKKKLLSKQRKAAAREQEDEANKAKSKKDDDPDGLQLLQTAKPLEDALKFLFPLQNLCPNDFEMHKLSFDIYYRQEKHLLCYKALHHMHRLAPSHHHTHEAIILFFSRLSTLDLSQFSENVGIIFADAQKTFKLSSLESVRSFNEEYTRAAKEGSNLISYVSALKMKIHLKEIDSAQLLQNIAAFKVPSDLTLDSALDVWSAAVGIASDKQEEKSILEKLRSSLQHLYPRALMFMSEEDRLAEQMKLADLQDDTVCESGESKDRMDVF